MRRTPDTFLYDEALLNTTHPRLFRERVTRDLVKQLGTSELPEEAVLALVRANQADPDEFRRGIEPLGVAGKLGPLRGRNSPRHFTSRPNPAFTSPRFYGRSTAIPLLSNFAIGRGAIKDAETLTLGCVWRRMGLD